MEEIIDNTSSSKGAAHMLHANTLQRPYWKLQLLEQARRQTNQIWLQWMLNLQRAGMAINPILRKMKRLGIAMKKLVQLSVEDII